MYSFFGLHKPKKIYPITTDSLSEKIDGAWETYKHSQQNAAKEKAFEFLTTTFLLYPKQPKNIIQEKLTWLMHIKESCDDTGHIPSIRYLPIETDITTMRIMKKFKDHSKDTIRKISTFGFGRNDYPMHAYCEKKWTEIERTRQLEKVITLHIKLINMLYEIKKDPLSNSTREAMNRELDTLDVEDPHRTLVANEYAESMSCHSMQERANNWRLEHNHPTSQTP